MSFFEVILFVFQKTLAEIFFCDARAKIKELWNPMETQIQNPSNPSHGTWYKSVPVYLARYNVHMAATWGLFWNVTKKL